MLIRIVLLIKLSLLGTTGFAQEDHTYEELKEDAVTRLVDELDTTLPKYIARVYAKQAAILQAKDLLTQVGKENQLRQDLWHEDNHVWAEAESFLIDGADLTIEERIIKPSWLRDAWYGHTHRILDAEGADEVAVHFKSKGGTLQRKVIEYYVGELSLTFSTLGPDRVVRWGLRGSEKEMKELQIKTYELKGSFGCGKFAHVNNPCNHEEMEPNYTTLNPIYDLTGFENTMRFASRGPGVEFMKMMMIQGVHEVHIYAEDVATHLRSKVLSKKNDLKPFIQEFQEKYH